MDLHLITCFIAVVDHGSVTRASKALFMSQPALSQAVQKLERQVGVVLFDRSSRRLAPTDSGKRFYCHAKRIVNDVALAKASVAKVRQLAVGSVDIVTSAAFSVDPMVQIVKAFRLHYPHLCVRVTVADSHEGVHTALRRGEAEIGLTELESPRPGTTAFPLAEQEIVVAGAAHLLSGLPDPLPHEHVRSVPLVLDLTDRLHPARTGGLLAEGAANIAVDCGSSTAMWELVSLGLGATVVSRALAEQQMPDATVRAFSPPIVRPVGLFCRSGDQTPAARAFLNVARNFRLDWRGEDGLQAS